MGKDIAGLNASIAKLQSSNQPNKTSSPNSSTPPSGKAAQRRAADPQR
ncbi:hypothetical protein M8494_31880 [Serratia ureilytica]